MGNSIPQKDVVDSGQAEEGWQPPPISTSQMRLTLGGMMLAMFLASLDQTIVATALPQIVGDLGGFDRFTWVATAYIVASTTVVPLAGTIADVYGRRWLYIIGISVFLVGSVLAGLTPTMSGLIGARAVQGVGGGIMMALSFVIIGDLFPPAERGKYQGLVASVFGISSVIGPTLGGFITDNLSWRWVFFINIPLGVIILIAFFIAFPNIRPTTKRRIDFLGAGLLILGIVPLLMALTWGGANNDWRSVQVIGAFAISAVALVSFVLVEMRTKDPLLPLKVFGNRLVLIPMIAVFLTGFAMFGAFIFIPLLFQGALGASATSSGAFLTPMMLGMVFGAALSGQILSRTGGHYRWQGLVGLAIMGVGFGMLSTVSVNIQFGEAVLWAVVMGVGLGVTFPLFTIAIQNAVPYQYLGITTSATQFFRSIGGSIGLAVLGAVMLTRFSRAVDASLPPEAARILSAGPLAEMVKNPNVLINPNALDAFRSAFTQIGGEAGAQMANQILDVLRASLASAIGDLFLLALVMVALSFVVTIFIKEIPLKGRGDSRK